MTRYRSATVADSNGIPRPLSAHASARAEANFSNNEAVNVPRTEFPVNVHERQQLPRSAVTATLHSARLLLSFHRNDGDRSGCRRNPLRQLFRGNVDDADDSPRLESNSIAISERERPKNFGTVRNKKQHTPGPVCCQPCWALEPAQPWAEG